MGRHARNGISAGLSPIPEPLLAEGALAVASWLPGGGGFANATRHRKTAPCTIVAIADQGAYEVARADGSRATARAGEAFLAQEGDWLDIIHRGRPMTATWVHLRVTLFASQDAARLIDLPAVLDAGRSARIREWIQATLTPEPGLSGALRRAEAGLATLRILAEAGQPSQAGRQLLARAAGLAPLAAWVGARLGEAISLADLAAAAGASKSRLHARFQGELGMPPLAWVRELRLQAARDRLLATAEPVAAIGAACGFSDPFHFSRAVRIRFGMPPLRLRASRLG